MQEGLVGTYETMAIAANGQLMPAEVISIMSSLNGEPVRVSGLRELRAARRLEQERRHLELLLDSRMPELDGVDLVRRLRTSGARIPIVLCSDDLEYASERGLEPGSVQGILQKPFSTDEPIRAIERARADGGPAARP